MTGRTRRSGWFAADSAAGANGSCDWTPQAPTSDLPSKLTSEAYIRSLHQKLTTSTLCLEPYVRVEALVARDQSRPGELRDSLLVDLLCVDDMICIRDRVTRDIQPGTSADGG